MRSTSAWNASHIMPGPSRGYSNSSMSVLICFAAGLAEPLEEHARDRREEREPLIRCAAHCAPMRLQGMPQTFSV